MMDKWTRLGPANPPRRTRYNEVPLYEEGLYDLGHDLYAWMVPNGSWGESNAGLIVGDREALLVDTLWDVAYTRMMLTSMSSLRRTQNPRIAQHHAQTSLIGTRTTQCTAQYDAQKMS